MKKRAKEQREVEQDHKVAETMNRAAALAGVFKTDVTSFNKHKLAVDKEVLDAKAKSVKEYAEVAEKAIAKAEAAKKTVKKTKKAKKATKKAKKATKKAKKAHKKAKKAHKKAKKAAK